MLRNPTDNYLAAYRAIAAYVLSSPLGTAIKPYLATRLQAACAPEGAPESYYFSSVEFESYYFSSVEFERAGTSCSIDAKLECKDGWSRPRTDAEGNEWMEYDLQCTVNHPCHGSADPATILARCALYSQAAMLAAEIQATWPRVMRMTATALEVKMRKIKEEQETARRRAQAIVEPHCKGLRTGKSVALTQAEVDGIQGFAGPMPGGSYTVCIGDRTYELRVSALGAGAMIERLA